LDYFATGRLAADTAADVITGMAAACESNGCALLGGETAEMPSMYADGEYDVAGTIVGVVEKDRIINGKRIGVGDVLIGLPSTGLHTNGYSLARAALFPTYSVDTFIDELGTTIGEALLAVHRSYLADIRPLLQTNMIHGLSHITGGGIVGNTSRILQPGQALDIDWSAWTVPPIFKLIQQAGDVSDAEMRKVFNLGIGMIAVVPEHAAQSVLTQWSAQGAVVVGTIAAA
jgi:phosphoribosylformylglycinamidine cyclo-ligase